MLLLTCTLYVCTYIWNIPWFFFVYDKSEYICVLYRTYATPIEEFLKNKNKRFLLSRLFLHSKMFSRFYFAIFLSNFPSSTWARCIFFTFRCLLCSVFFGARIFSQTKENKAKKWNAIAKKRRREKRNSIWNFIRNR